MTVICFRCAAEVEVPDGMVSLARCSCGSRCFRWDDHAARFEARPHAQTRQVAA